MITKFKLFESPHYIIKDNEKYFFNRDFIITFGYWKNELLSSKNKFHDNLSDDIDFTMSDIPCRIKLKYPGRLFLDKKIVTFWYFPENYKKFKKLIDDLEKNEDIELWNDPEWTVEIPNEKIDEDEWTHWDDENVSYVPLTQYKFLNTWSDEILNIQHIVSPLKKKTKSFKQHKMKYSLPGEPEIFAKRRLKYLYQENSNKYGDLSKGKFVNVKYKIINTDWKGNSETLITDFKIHKIEDNYIEVIAKGYVYVYLSKYGWGGYKNRNKKGWIEFDNMNKDRKVITQLPKKSVQDGTKKIKVYYGWNEINNNSQPTLTKQTQKQIDQKKMDDWNKRIRYLL